MTNLFLRNDQESKAVLAKVLAAGPVGVIRSDSPSAPGSTAVLLPAAGKFVFSDGSGRIEIVTAATENITGNKWWHLSSKSIDIDLSGQLSINDGTAARLRSAGELADGSVALFFQLKRKGAMAGDDKLVILYNNEVRRVYSIADFLDKAKGMKELINALPKKPPSNSEAEPLGFFLIDRYVYVYALLPYLVMDVYLLDPSSVDGFSHGASYIEKPQENAEEKKSSSDHRYDLINGFIIVEDRVDVANQTRNGVPNKPRYKVALVVNLRDETSGQETKAVWNEIASHSQALSTCIRQADTLSSCSIQELNNAASNSKLMVLSVAVESGEPKRAFRKIVVVNMDNFNSYDLDVDLLSDLRGGRPGDASSMFNDVIATGSLSEFTLGLPEDQAVHFYHVEGGSPHFIGTFAWNKDVDEWAVTPDGELLLGISDGNGVVWDFATRPSDRATILVQKPLVELTALGCKLGILRTAPTSEVWETNTGLNNTPEPVRCVVSGRL
jgi:hypothetical protein